jgi:hypothetical protein
MVFLDYVDGNITNCTWTDLSIIGNVRPDWFMDKRGDSTDVQYLGDQHVYYLGQPRLVKQWRKMDFANQYFTMSMQANPGADGVHWPLILNIPGEGFGDDSLQHYSNHQLLDDSHDALFLVDEAYMAVHGNGSCPQIMSDGPDGPPTGQTEHIPSNLEREAVSWRSIQHTLSPVWKELIEEEPKCAPETNVIEVAKGVTAEVCYNVTAAALSVAVTMDMAGVTEQVWMAVQFRDTDECLMTPRGGGDGEVIFAHASEGFAYTVHHGPLQASLKRFDATAASKFMEGLQALDSANGYSGGAVEYAGGKGTLRFTRAFATQPQALHMSYALGSTKAVGYHKSRGCFSVPAVRQCGAPVRVTAAESNFQKPMDLDNAWGSGALHVIPHRLSLVLALSVWIMALMVR